MNVAATGLVTFSDGSAVLAKILVVSGVAAYTSTDFTAGVHALTVSYSGDASYVGSSATFDLLIQAPAAVLLTSTPNPSAAGQAITFTAAITPATATGLVQFFEGSALWATVPVTSGRAAFSLSELAAGPHTLVASYTGDAAVAAGFSNQLVQTVNVPPPGAPSNLNASTAGSSQINLTWFASPTSAVTYNVYAGATSGFVPSAANRIAAGVASTSYAASGLNPSTAYYFRVKAANAGGESAATNQATATTAAPGASCQVTYGVKSQWSNGFQGELSIRNTGTAPINGWTLTWTWPGSQRITQSWTADFSQAGTAVQLTNESWNRTIAPHATLTAIGFLGSYTGTNKAPAVFYVNSVRCN